jgi:hypothetical protein
MARHDRRNRLVHVLRRALPAVVAALALAAPGGATAANGQGLTFHASFGARARLGAPTAIVFSGDIADRGQPVTEIRLLTPAGVDLATSGLGVSSCSRPASDILDVMVPAAGGPPCPANALMGLGSAVASLDMEPRIDGSATLDVYAGGSVADKPGLVVVANTYNPVRFHLFYQGYLYIPPPGFGIGVAIMLPQSPSPPFGAALMLSRVKAAIGAPSITYTKRRRGRRVAYHPRGVTLPERCPRHGFRFRLIVRFADGTRRQADAVAPCPAPRRRR